MEKELIRLLDSFKVYTKKKCLYVIEYKGVNITLPSGKSSWGSLQAAKLAIRNAFYSFGDSKKRIEAIKELENKEIIKYIKIF